MNSLYVHTKTVYLKKKKKNSIIIRIIESRIAYDKSVSLTSSINERTNKIIAAQKEEKRMKCKQEADM